MSRPPGLSVRLKLTLSYAGFLVVAGALLLAIVWAFLLRYVPDGDLTGTGSGGFVPNRSDLLRAFAPAAAAVLVFLLALGVLGGWFLAGRMLAPLTRITDAARLAARGSLAHRIDLQGRQDEFRELADAFDTMLGRIEASIAEQKRFAANASHELRTPLAATKTVIEVAQGDPERDVDAVLDRLAVVNRRAIDLSEALLTLSRADHGAVEQELVDLSLLADDAVEILVTLADSRGVEIDVSGPVASVRGSLPLLRQLVTNLVHNAIVHNRPEAGSISIVTRIDPATATLVVENTGAELPEDVVVTLIEPFQRGAARVRGHDEGLGLGLAIAQSIVRAHAGSLSVDGRAGGGLRVTVSLPAAR
ncbi:sensor histidine kinase [Agromyces atrinae]|uniref:histidine kinase n=1 Tax=Agromyces atrinae TaxID=592376 RepID=A0A4Q2M499_9MICO|nr:HAMP domain-containing sensor histidine kinase [Agromyces atrinae]NYD66327.1 two-component system sensor histidine kinase VanS [Agromyces atrinae]RXZ86648.1 HAMP domain-containing histidine kinase [Agromyces atrinae]